VQNNNHTTGKQEGQEDGKIAKEIAREETKPMLITKSDF
jgi:hypothetical protein